MRSARAQFWLGVAVLESKVLAFLSGMLQPLLPLPEGVSRGGCRSHELGGTLGWRLHLRAKGNPISLWTLIFGISGYGSRLVYIRPFCNTVDSP